MLHIDAIATTEINTRRCWAVLALLAAVTGCSDDPVSLGGAVAVDRSALSSYAAVWEGYVEAYTFESGSDRVQLVLDSSGNGTITFGDATPRALPTDADNPFPDLAMYELPSLMTFDRVHEGFLHEMAEAVVQEERLRARTGPTNVYGAAACALQTPVQRVCEDDACPFTCFPNFPNAPELAVRCFNSPPPDDTMETELSCGKVFLCEGLSVCECTATECFARDPGDAIVIDGALDEAGTRLVGSLAGSFGGRTDILAIRLTKQR